MLKETSAVMEKLGETVQEEPTRKSYRLGDELSEAKPETKKKEGPKEERTQSDNPYFPHKQRETIRQVLMHRRLSELREYDAYFGLKVSGESKPSIVKELVLQIANLPEMRRQLYDLRAEGIELLGRILQEDPLPVTKDEISLLEPILSLGYVYILHSARENKDYARFSVEGETMAWTLRRTGYKEKHRKMQWLFKCLKTIVVLHGIALVSVLYEMFLRGEDMALSADEFDNLLERVPEWKNPCSRKGEMLEWKMVPEIIEMIRRRQNSCGKDYYLPGREEIESYSEYGFCISEPAYRRLLEYMLQEMKLKEKQALDCRARAQSALAFGVSAEDYVERLRDILRNAIVSSHKSALLKLTKEAKKVTRCWGEKGNIPEEYEPGGTKKPKQKPLDKEKKIYPNDPCPCGCGKKYKKCCGRR